ncbi:site-specific integrase [Thioalkalivibrio sp. ALE11]|uniref:site-specific integrase n=1 Tax=Thioalkalivibrio sp. ALE11 TaxID=1265494 RepID=UPI00037D14D5|nr:site-specific integrase [Thioalkalivibrio sp. ALE11]
MSRFASSSAETGDGWNWVTVARLEPLPAVWGRWRHIWHPFEDILTLHRAEEWPWHDEIPGAQLFCPPEFQKLMESLFDHCPSLFASAKEGPPEKIHASFEGMMSLARTHGPEGRDFVTRWRILEVLDAGNRLGRWRIPIRMIPAPLPSPPSPMFTVESFEKMVEHEGFYDAFVSSLTEAAPPDVSDMPERVFWGQALTSLCLLSGVLQAKWLWAAPEAIQAAEPHFEWLDLVLDGQADQDPEKANRPRIQRVFLDPISRWLLVRASRQGFPDPPQGRRDPRGLFQMMKGYAQHCGFQDSLPRNWSDLKDIATTRLALYIPPHLIGHAKGYYAPASLPAHVWGRIFSKPDRISMDPVKRELAAANAGSGTTEKGDEHESETLSPSGVRKVIGELGGAIRNSSPRNPHALEDWLAEHASDEPSQTAVDSAPSLRLLGYWALHWLFRGGHGRRALKPKTAYNHYNAIAARLYGQMGLEDFSRIETPGDFIELYNNALDDAETGAQRKRIANALRSFHDFLSATYPQVPTLEDSGVFEARHHQPHAVDANFLDPDDFGWVVRWLDWRHGPGTAAAEIRVLIACLAYYCGYRRSEVVALRLGDFDPPPWLDIVVQPNTTRALKTANAHRLSPLRSLMPKAYLDRLVEWINRRRDEARKAELSEHDTPLFAPLPGTPDTSAYGNASNLLTGPLEDITDALVRVTGDPTLRFHHLRHSFANRLFLTLWRGENMDQSDHIGWYDRLIGFEDPAGVRQALVGKAGVQRRSLRLLSMLLGHATTDITLNHYVHLADFLLGRAVRKATPPLDAKQLANLCGVDEHTIYKTRQSLGTSDAATIVEHFTTKVDGGAHCCQVHPSATQKKLQKPEDPYIRRILFTDALNQLAEGEDTSPDFAFPWKPERIDEALQLAKSYPDHWRQSRTGQGAPVLEPPRTQQDQRLAKHTLAFLDGLRARDRRNFVTGYLRGAQPDTALDTRFAQVAQAKRWIELLHHLELLSSVEFRHMPNTTARFTSPRNQHQYWQDRLGDSIELATGPSGAPNPEDRVWSERGRIVCTRTTPPAHGRDRWVYGVRWAFTITAFELKKDD